MTDPLSGNHDEKGLTDGKSATTAAAGADAQGIHSPRAEQTAEARGSDRRRHRRDDLALSELVYTLPGLRLLVRSAEAELLDEADRLLGAFGKGLFRADTEAELTIATAADLPEPPDEAKLLWQGEKARGLSARYWSAGTARQMDLDRLACTRVDLSAASAEIFLTPAGRWSLVFGCLTPAIAMLLQRTRQYVLHGACVALPERPHRSTLIIGPSGTGKTTTAVAAAGAGLRLLSDDSTVLSLGGNGCVLWPLPRPCKIHRRTMELCPHLAALTAEPIPGCEDEQAVELGSISPGPPIVTAAEVVIMLTERSGSEHRLRRVEPVEALTRLARENLRVAGDSRSAGPGGDAFTALAALARQGRCYDLSAGADLASLGVLIRQTLEQGE